MQTEIVTEPIIEPVTKSEILDVQDSWNREINDDELQSFLDRHIKAIGGLALDDIELAS